MLRFIVDESTGVAVANYLKQQGHDVLFVGEAMFSAIAAESHPHILRGI